MFRDLALTDTAAAMPSMIFDALFEREPRLRVLEPAVDVYEYKDRFQLEADLPGFTEDEIKVEFAEGKLVIEASRAQKAPSESSEECVALIQERPNLSFRRSFTLGDRVNPDAIQADYQNGTLKVTLPKTEKVQPRVIPISRYSTSSRN
jgi:HSP20 family molecular chaperone IbpA